MLDHQNEEVHRFQHPEVLSDAIVYEFLVHQNDCNDAHQRVAYQRTMHKH